MTSFRVLSVVVLAGLAGLPAAADPAPGPAKKAAGDAPTLWNLPSVTPDVPPAPAPAPDGVTVLDPGVLLVVTHKTPCIVRGFPSGKLRAVGRELKDGETMILPAKYYDAGKVVEQEREFKGPLWVYRVRCETSGAAVGGDCDLMVLPVGGTESDMIVRRVRCNVGPQPPPGPGPDPDPAPKPPQPVTSFRVIFVYETSDPITPAMQKVMFGEDVVKYLDANTTGKGWRRFDKDVDATNDRDAEIKALWAAAKPKITTVPCVVISVNRNADIVPLPATPEDAVTLFRKYKEGR